jgi:hypothetical protein
VINLSWKGDVLRERYMFWGGYVLGRRCSWTDMFWVGCAVLGGIFFFEELLFWESNVGVAWQGSSMV